MYAEAANVGLRIEDALHLKQVVFKGFETSLDISVCHNQHYCPKRHFDFLSCD